MLGGKDGGETEWKAWTAGRNERPLYDHHRMDVYRVAVQFLAWRHGALTRLPRSSDLADQLTRASTSIVLNIAEGCGEAPGPERRRFFRMARRSATECDAALDIAAALEVEAPPVLEQGRELLSRILSMLAVLTQAKI
jgi:four helix bundle protein